MLWLIRKNINFPHILLSIVKSIKMKKTLNQLATNLKVRLLKNTKIVLGEIEQYS